MFLKMSYIVVITNCCPLTEQESLACLPESSAQQRGVWPTHALVRG